MVRFDSRKPKIIGSLVEIDSRFLQTLARLVNIELELDSEFPDFDFTL
jgi:hypothetical protein